MPVIGGLVTCITGSGVKLHTNREGCISAVRAETSYNRFSSETLPSEETSMLSLNAIMSNSVVLATVGSAVVSVVLSIACAIAGFCGKEEAVEVTPVEAETIETSAMDYGWMRAA